MGVIKDLFKDAVGQDSVPVKGSGPGKYDFQEIPDTAGRDGGLLRELYRDTTVSAGPGVSGPVKDLFKDAVDK